MTRGRRRKNEGWNTVNGGEILEEKLGEGGRNKSKELGKAREVKRETGKG